MVRGSKWVRIAIVFLSILGIAACSDDEGEVMVETIVLSGSFITDGGQSQMTASVLPADASNQEVSWSVTDESIATISETGLLSAVSNGTVQVVATAQDGSGVTGSRWVGVEGVLIPLESIKIIGSDITDGQPQNLTVEYTPTDATTQEVNWSVSPENIATINSVGRLNPLIDGTVTVTATSKNNPDISATLSINISGVVDNVDGQTVDNASDLLTALSQALAGDKIYVRAGTYAFGSTVRLNNDGQEGQMISLLAYPGDDRPVFDFSSMSESSSNRGVQLSGDYWKVKGIDFYNAGDNGMFISGHNNLIEHCYFYENSDTGLQIGNGASNNTVLNCDSYFNADSSIENADGFACKLDAGDGNQFIGCRAWNNLDDGWDGYMRGNDNITTYYEDCWAIRNGLMKNGTVGGGDGNGFKTGGSDDKLLKHNAKYVNCIAAENVYDGFDHNSNRGDVTIYNCAGYNNGRNINFGSGNIANQLIIKNTVTIGGNGDSYQATTTDLANNSWQNGLTANADDYVSLDVDLLLAPRKADGSLPDVDYMKLVSGSDLIDAGVNVGEDFNGSQPDIGPFESE